MPVQAKICGLKDPAALAAAVSGGARYVGFMFFPQSPRDIKPAEAAALAAKLPGHVTPVGVMVDPTDEHIDAVLRAVKLPVVQLHGSETPERVAAIGRRGGLSVMKTIKVGSEDDVAGAARYEAAADMLLFDTRPVDTSKDALPGGTGRSFDWSLVSGFSSSLPWMLAGGLHAGNVAEAVAISGAKIVDVSSGVETAPGKKSTEKIAAFLNVVRGL
jgi:phosphoribosylanthranilate isomerase